MKILYFANVRIPTEKAHGIQIIKMCESFGNANTNLELILPTRINKDFNRVDIFDHYRVRRNFSILKLTTFDPRFLLKFPSGTYIKVQIILFSRSIKKFLKNKNLDNTILYTRDQYLLPTLFQFSNKVVWEAHDLPTRKNVYADYWQKCHKIITITEGLKGDLVSLGIQASKILVAPDGVDLNQFTKNDKSKNELRSELNLPIDKKVVLYSGHLYAWKGVDVLAEASNLLGNNNTVVAFLGGTQENIEKFKNKYEDYKNIIILGHINQPDVPSYLQVADVLVLPNSGQSKISAKYTSPMKLFEYMAAGKPIVASALPSIKEVLNNANSVLVEPDSPKALAQGIDDVLNDKSLGQIISQNALENVKVYTWANRVKTILDLI